VVAAFDRVLGQDTAVLTLKRAIASGRTHHAYRFEGPDGVGKELTAFAFAQALVCRDGAGCGGCSACRRAVTLSDEPPHVPTHPDVVLVGRGLYPPGVLGRTTAETSGIGVEQIRRIVLSRVDYPPHEGRALVFIVRAAHELTTNAANALLKTLEEPRPRIHFVLVTDQPRRLLDTIRSRTLPVRFGPLPDDALNTIVGGLELTASEDLLALASGSAARAIELGDAEQVERRRSFIRAVLAAMRAPDLGAAVELAASESRDRASLAQDLRGLGQYFAVAARRDAGTQPSRALRCAQSHAHVQETLNRLERHTPPALALEALLARLRRA
jgi:DNA polymerase-3 subunit delta'